MLVVMYGKLQYYLDRYVPAEVRLYFKTGTGELYIHML